MQLPEAITLLKQLIEKQSKHRDYDHVVRLAKRLYALITGKGIEVLLKRFVKREDPELFKQRIEITESTTPAVCDSIQVPYNKVTASDRIKTKVNIKDRNRKKIVEEMMKGFYGEPDKDSRGLTYWMNTRYRELSFTDPNAWVVVEWDPEPDLSKPLQPRPFEVSAEQAWDFKKKNDRLIWLFVAEKCSYKKKSRQQVPGVVKTETCDGMKYTLYDQDVTVVMEQVDDDYFDELVEGERVQVGKNTYAMRTGQPKLGYPPAFPIGYKRDLATDGRTYVNPFNAGMCFLNKSLKTVSELDLTMTMHVFPQKLAFVQACPGEGPAPHQKCSRGYMKSGKVCSRCGGTGHLVHTTAQEAVYVPMPEDPKDAISLDNMVVYKAPPIDLVKFQNEYVLQLERQVHQAVFNSTAFVKKNIAAGADGAEDVEITATGEDYNMESVSLAIKPYKDHYSEMWVDLVTTFARLAEVPKEKIDVAHRFPVDDKLKNTRILLSELKNANDSGAPSFMIDAINDDLAEITFVGDPTALLQYKVKKRYYPFSGKNTEQVSELMASRWIPDQLKMLYANFESIFREIEEENPLFYEMSDTAQQNQIVADKISEWMDRLQPMAAMPPGFVLPPTDAGSGEEEEDEEGTE